MVDIRQILAALALGTAASQLMAFQTLAEAGGAAAKAPAATVPGAGKAAPVPRLSADEVVSRHIAARGGAQAWKEVQAMQLSGKFEAGRGDNLERAHQLVNAGKKASGKGTNAEIAAANGAKDSGKEIELPFTLDLKRAKRTRLEVLFGGKTAVQVFDGQQGWKLRPFLNRDDAEPFTADEARDAASHADLDGPLIDRAASGARVDLDGIEAIAGQPAYKLKVTLKTGIVQHVWIDAKTFLDVKVEDIPKRRDGKMHAVYVYQRDFRSVQGVVIPFVLETAVDGYPETHKLQVEKVAINPRLDDALFSKPHA